MPAQTESQALNTDTVVPTAPAAPYAAPNHCRNCNAVAELDYCPACGQETRQHVPTAGEFLHEFIGHHIALEGKLWGTIGLLLFKPGRLTAEYLAGRRARYIQPLRLYLTLSVLFFALIKYASSDVKLFVSDASPTPVTAGKVEPNVLPTVPDSLHGKARKSDTAEADDDADGNGTVAVDNVVKKIAPTWAPKLTTFWRLSDADKTRIISNAFLEYVPYAMFCMLPLFALYLKVLYLGKGKRYGEHLLFALHTNAFAFVLFGLITLVPRGGVKFLLFIWLASYLPMAMRRVYGGGRLATFARWALLMATHMLVMTCAIVGTLLMAVVH